MNNYSSECTNFFARYSDKGRAFVALTGLTHKEFKVLVPVFGKRFLKWVKRHTLKGTKRSGQRPYVEYCNSPLLSTEDKLMFVLTYLRKGTTQDIFGAVFGMSQPTANKWIHLLHPRLTEALGDLGERPARKVSQLRSALKKVKTRPLFFQDGTERPIPRPQDPVLQELFYSGKKKKHCIKNNVLIDRRAKILLLTPTCEGTKHDKKIADETGLVLPPGSRLCQDTGFQGFTLPHVTILQPLKKPRGKELSPQQKASNRAISRLRIRVEHAIGGIKRYRIVKDVVRARKDNFRDRVMETCCALHNFRLNYRPWHYPSDSAKV